MPCAVGSQHYLINAIGVEEERGRAQSKASNRDVPLRLGSGRGTIARSKFKNLFPSADNLSKVGWSLGYVSAIDSNGQTIWIADAHRDDGKRFVVHADELLTAFLELESAIRACGELF